VSLAQRFEQPLPVLEVSTDAISLETKDTATGVLTIKNAGGGTLKGYVAPRHRALTFEPDHWEGNTAKLRYTFNPAHADMTLGESFTTQLFVCSNGGEMVLPVIVKLTKMAITTRDGQVLANVKEFYEYALAHPSGARQVFTDSEFYMLLLAVGYPFMEVYESLHKDANRERAMDNFFILSGLKEKTTIALPNHHFVYDRPPSFEEKIHGYITVEKSDAGFYEGTIDKENHVSWLTLSANRLIPADFDEDNRARINFTIDPTKIRTIHAHERVYIGEHVAEITFRRLPPLTARLNRDAYRFDDKGVIEIANHTGEDLTIEVFCADAHIRFNAQRFVVGKFHEIPFTVKLSTLMNAGRLFRKTPYLHTKIEIKGKKSGWEQKLTLHVNVGEW